MSKKTLIGNTPMDAPVPEESNGDHPAGTDGVPPDVFHRAYEGAAPWDTGRAQPRVLELIEQRVFDGEILDLGCGSGENAIALANAGYAVHGVDLVPAAIALARKKLADTGVQGITLQAANALELDLGRQFDTILDTGVFHVFSDDDRPTYARVAAAHLRAGGRLHIVVFNEHQGGGGPRRVTQDEIRGTFSSARWSVESIVASVYDTASGHKQAWHATIRRTEA